MTNVPPSSKVLTIIGLSIEGLTLIALWSITALLSRVPHWLDEAIRFVSEDANEYIEIMSAFPYIRIILVIFSVFSTLLWSVNLVFFIPLIRGSKSERFTSNVFLYQAILGGILLFSNQLLGAIYLISGIIGRNDLEKTIENVREGI